MKPRICIAGLLGAGFGQMALAAAAAAQEVASFNLALGQCRTDPDGNIVVDYEVGGKPDGLNDLGPFEIKTTAQPYYVDHVALRYLTGGVMFDKRSVRAFHEDRFPNELPPARLWAIGISL